MNADTRSDRAINRIRNAVGTIGVRSGEAVHAEHHGAERQTGLEAVATRLEAIADQLEKVLKT